MGHIKLNKQNFFHNLDFFSKICTKQKLCVALKDNAYGHGTQQMAILLQEYGVKHVFVRDMTEANIASKYGFDSILVLYDIPLEKLSHNSSIVISANSLQWLEKIPNGSKIELKVDSGMHRNGITKEQVNKALEIIKEKQLILNGVFTHFCCSDEQNSYTSFQEKNFNEIVDIIKENWDNDFRIHCANSTGALKVDMSKYDLARVGIGVYGYLDLEEEKFLKPVMSLYASKVASQSIKKGEHIGYGSKAFIAPKDMIVSNYDIGYGDGFLRLGEKKKAKISNGLDILGRVSMDSFSVESTDDEICVFDDVSHLAEVHDTIKYEILTNLKESIKRVIV